MRKYLLTLRRKSLRRNKQRQKANNAYSDILCATSIVRAALSFPDSTH